MHVSGWDLRLLSIIDRTQIVLHYHNFKSTSEEYELYGMTQGLHTESGAVWREIRKPDKAIDTGKSLQSLF